MRGVSVVIPMYNASTSIKKCLSSVLGQDVSDVQIILVDDGSSDNCSQVAKNYLEQNSFSNFKIIRQKNGGPGKARNTGIQNSDCDYIAFLDSDDIWEKSHLNILLSKIKELNADFVCTSKNIKITDTKKITLRKMMFRCLVQSSTTLIKKTILEKNQFRDGKRYSEDYDLWLRIADDGACMYLLPVIDVHSCDDKEMYGESGLSKNLWHMEKNELENYRFLLNTHSVSVFLYICAVVFSMFKYILRIIKTFIRKR
ncbi:glycosyltransferase family 2 protein [Treponema sp.]|uniref:glycosyltransferase family 2 protein n=1 Tax=Treponema sp. TaxID=166 RepID=UPI00298DAC29|nr:glycosyltransferase family 2 protein [Treponema sp.]MCR5612478.1 glycosyltransferase [Treponema sp.]